jgi:hypothetical protein
MSVSAKIHALERFLTLSQPWRIVTKIEIYQLTSISFHKKQIKDCNDVCIAKQNGFIFMPVSIAYGDQQHIFLFLLLLL